MNDLAGLLIGVAVGMSIVVNLGILMANLKIYTEIMKIRELTRGQG